ncbi:MAG TPA: efflux RND transporter periplasmic adaptor subunit, partial [Xanthobacteraceae bacterium]|nr:efflux RND transporter periplasmic adaptor subunit [Xanthobacteraceae bacterium]
LVSRRRTLAVLAVIAVAGAAAATWKGNLQGFWSPQGAVAQAPAQPRLVAVEIAKAVKKSTPVRIEALGTVMPIASVAIKSRIDSEITNVHFADGARVKQGDVLISLDSRTIEAQILQAEGNIARDRAQLEGAERDLRRYTELVAKGATAITNLDNAKTQAAVYTAALMADEAILKNLQVQLSYATIRAPISGRISAASVKIGNFVRSADLAPIATIVQTAPVYVSFPIPQVQLPALHDALAEGSSSIEAIVPGDNRQAVGRIAMVENTVDSATGMVNVRATMPNENEVLWPGTLVQTYLNLRNEELVTVPSAAVQVGQTGNYVYVIKNDVAELHPVKIARTLGSETVLESGVADGDVVVINGHLQLTNGARVAIRAPKKSDS